MQLLKHFAYIIGFSVILRAKKPEKPAFSWSLIARCSMLVLIRSSLMIPIQILFLNRPHSIDKNSNTSPRLSGQFSLFGFVFFLLKSLLGIAVLSLKPRSHVWIFIYRTLTSPTSEAGTRDEPLRTSAWEANRTWAIGLESKLYFRADIWQGSICGFS